ncbi:PREDICTED: cysteine-rich protein 2-like [Galeopterus variegatus]|uniref:Cysteine-rich protein 2-like n=1 Tax=Galeopterus variegatus TaxID=482537 RepID=A0ABM0R585_GALVR|nr:PREDICTED: cysteine-rich protein 2-like [Galeopterus variegatus]
MNTEGTCAAHSQTPSASGIGSGTDLSVHHRASETLWRNGVQSLLLPRLGLVIGAQRHHDGQPYCHKPCYGILFGPKGVNTGAVGSYIYDRDPEGQAQP